ncbi:hypothetical protein R3W88_031934 [Solanum pinnatisectum]|uniref:Uncharacterized protein n=1 Tax=Solanum pinnatisectum TaxID=50273 RepID=A0AAV9LRM4_9SOLN|nr:hypothetical protein R3W88_031934 [Solanum pinnatisectum]
MDLSPAIDIETLPAKVVLPSPAPRPSGICSTSPSMTTSSSTTPLPPRSIASAAASRPPLTQATILRMGHLAHSTDRRASRLEAIVPGMIESALAAAVTPLRESIDTLTARIDVCYLYMWEHIVLSYKLHFHDFKESSIKELRLGQDEFEDEETENQSLLAIEQTNKYDFLALVAITKPGEAENSCQTQETILALMAGSDSKEEEEDKKDQKTNRVEESMHLIFNEGHNQTHQGMVDHLEDLGMNPPNTKRCHVGKSPIPPTSSPVMLDSELEDISASIPSASNPSSQKPNKNILKYLEIGKEKYFRTKPLLRGRTFHTKILSIDVVKRGHLFLDTKLLVLGKEVVEFYMNLTILEGKVITSTINGVELVFDHIRLGEILKFPTNELFSQGRVSTRARKVLKGEMAPFHKLLFDIVHKEILPRDIDDMTIYWPSLMIKHMARIVDPQPGSHQLAYGSLLSIVFKDFSVPLGEGKSLTRVDIVTK